MRIPSRTFHTLNNKPCSRTQVSRFGDTPWIHLPVVIAPRAPHWGMGPTIIIYTIRLVHPHNSPLRLPEVQALVIEDPRLGVQHRLNGMSCHFLPLRRTTFEPTIGLVSQSNPTQQPQYNPVQSQALTPPMNCIVQRRSPQKPVTPIYHFRHDTEAYTSGRNSLLAYSAPHSRSPMPPIGDDSYEDTSSIQHHTGTTHYAETQPTVMSQSIGGTEGRDDEEYDEETLEGEDCDRAEEEGKKEKPKSKFQEYLEKTRSQVMCS